METKQITQIKIYKLILNPMRGNTESLSIVAIAYDTQKLIDWYKNQIATEPWKDYGASSFPPKGAFAGYQNDNHCWHKVFQQGSKLEWYNPSNYSDIGNTDLNQWGLGISEEWATKEAINYFLNNHPDVQIIE